MKAFRTTDRDEKNIATIILERGAANESDAIRLALEETASKKAQLAIRPRLPPIKDLRQTKALLEQFHRTLADSIRTGWPDHINGESSERATKVEAARQLFEGMLQEIRPRFLELTVLCALVAGATAIDINGTKAAAHTMAGFVRTQRELAEDPSVPEPERKKAQYNTNHYQPLIELLEKSGLI
jgi:hypothetical protein